MFTKAYIPHKGYWSSPFSRWQMSFQYENAITLGANTTKKFFEMRGYSPDILDGCLLGMTVAQWGWFYACPWYCALIGAEKIAGPTISQACATGATSIYMAANNIETDAYQTVLAATTDRCSNGPHLVWGNPLGPGGEVLHENQMMDNFNRDPYAGEPMFQTAEHVAAEYGGITKEQCDDLTIRRYEQYMDSMKNDREFQKGYMIPVDAKISRKKTVLVETDEGITPCTKEGMAPLKPALPGGVISPAAQTHPADGNAGVIVTTKEKARELSHDKNVTIQILSYGYARSKKARMAAAVTPAATMALKNAGVEVKDLAAVKTHNPFIVNDIVMGGLMKIPEKIFNNYGSSLIFGHPQGPTGTRCTVELIEELVKIGGGYGLFAGCAAGDTAAAVVVKVN
jgi:acetyl-CoA acetyltransferase